MTRNRRKKQRGSAASQPKSIPAPKISVTVSPVAMPQATPLPVVDLPATRVRAAMGDRLIVFVGMMAAGKTSVGRMVAQHLAIPFVDADHEIETAAQMTIPEIFVQRGEAEFRSGERRVIARLLRDGPRVLATGGGAYMSVETRDAIKARGIAVWLKVDTETILRRARKRNNRPLLQTADPEATVHELIRVRYPIYEQADVTIVSDNLTHEQTTALVLGSLDALLCPVARPKADAVTAVALEA
jgi:shikimate kinase